MDFAALPPEVNSARMYTGPGSAPLLAAAAAWSALAADLQGAAAGYEEVIGELSGAWLGPSAATMATALAPYLEWLRTTASAAEHTATKVRAAAAAYEGAYTATVPPPVITANRTQLGRLRATNLLGQNTAAIAATEAAYAQMWAQDATTMYGYAGNASAASTLTPFGPPPQATNPAGQGSQTAVAAQSAAGAAVSHTQNALAALPQAMQALTAPGAVAGLGATAGAAPAIGLDPTLELAIAALAASVFGSVVIDGAGTFGIDVAGSFGIDLIGVGAPGALEQLIAGLMSSHTPPGGVAAGAAGASPMAAPTAAMGQAATVRTLSVPPAWTANAPSVVYQVTAGASSGASSAPAVAASESHLPIAEMATAALAGRAMAGVGRGSQGAEPRRVLGSGPETVRAGRITEIADDLRELADLHAAGILTDAEFAEQKRRLLD